MMPVWWRRTWMSLISTFYALWDGVKITGLDSGASWLSVHSYGISRAGAMCVSLVHSHGGYGPLRPLLGPDESARNFAHPGPTTPSLPACTPWMPDWQPVPVQPGVELFFHFVGFIHCKYIVAGGYTSGAAIQLFRQLICVCIVCYIRTCIMSIVVGRRGYCPVVERRRGSCSPFWWFSTGGLPEWGHFSKVGLRSDCSGACACPVGFVRLCFW